MLILLVANFAQLSVPMQARVLISTAPWAGQSHNTVLVGFHHMHCDTRHALDMRRNMRLCTYLCTPLITSNPSLKWR